MYSFSLWLHVTVLKELWGGVLHNITNPSFQDSSLMTYSLPIVPLMSNPSQPQPGYVAFPKLLIEDHRNPPQASLEPVEEPEHQEFGFW